MTEREKKLNAAKAQLAGMEDDIANAMWLERNTRRAAEDARHEHEKATKALERIEEEVSEIEDRIRELETADAERAKGGAA